MKKLQCMMFAMAALALSLSGPASAQTEPTTVALTNESAVKATPKISRLAPKYEGNWKRAGEGGRDLEAGMNFVVLSQDGATAAGKFTSLAAGANVRADQCFALYDEPFEAQYVEDKKAWQFVVSSARCGKWRYLFSVQADGRLTGQYRGKDFDGVTNFDLKPIGLVAKTDD